MIPKSKKKSENKQSYKMKVISLHEETPKNFADPTPSLEAGLKVIFLFLIVFVFFGPIGLFLEFGWELRRFLGFNHVD